MDAADVKAVLPSEVPTAQRDGAAIGDQPQGDERTGSSSRSSSSRSSISRGSRRRGPSNLLGHRERQHHQTGAQVKCRCSVVLSPRLGRECCGAIHTNNRPLALRLHLAAQAWAMLWRTSRQPEPRTGDRRTAGVVRLDADATRFLRGRSASLLSFGDSALALGE